MGNGQGIKPPTVLTVDIETSGLLGAISNPLLTGTLIQMPFFPIHGMGSWHHDTNPEYRGTPWADMYRLTKREKAVAGLHTILAKLKVLKNISEDEFRVIRSLSVKRLKRAKWARYQQNKV